MLSLICPECGKQFYRQECHAKRTKENRCSRKCNGLARGREWAKHGHKGGKKSIEERRQLSDAWTGKNNPSWKGGVTYRNRKGNYSNQPIKYVRCPDEFKSMSRKDGYVMEHRLKVAQTISRALSRSEVVHHINHDATDNRVENLMLFASNADHKRYEHGGEVNPIWHCKGAGDE